MPPSSGDAAPVEAAFPIAIGLGALQLAHELGHYSFDRVVVCDDPETVDLLLGNDFHFEPAGEAADGTALFAVYRRERPLNTTNPSKED